MRPFDCCKPDRLNSTLVLRSTRPLIRCLLAFTQRLAGDTAGAKVTAEQARNTLEPLCKDQPDNACFAAWSVSKLMPLLGEKDSALKEAEHAIMLCRVLKIGWTDLAAKRTWH